MGTAAQWAWSAPARLHAAAMSRRARRLLLGLFILAAGASSSCVDRTLGSTGQPRYCTPSMTDYEGELLDPESLYYLTLDLH